MQVVRLPLHNLQEVGLNCSHRASCGMKSVYISLASVGRLTVYTLSSYIPPRIPHFLEFAPRVRNLQRCNPHVQWTVQIPGAAVPWFQNEFSVKMSF